MRRLSEDRFQGDPRSASAQKGDHVFEAQPMVMLAVLGVFSESALPIAETKGNLASWR
jgi:hypothetical protein